VVAIGVLRASVDEDEGGQVLCFKFSWRIHQHAFYFGAVGGGPAIRHGLGQIALGQQLVELGDGTRLRQFVGALGQVDFRWALGGRVGKRYALGLRLPRGGGGFVGSGPCFELYYGGFWGRLGQELHLGALAAGAEHGAVWERRVVNDFARVVGEPALRVSFFGWSGSIVDLDPVEARLRIFILFIERPEVDLKEQMAVVGRPLQT